MKFPIMNKRTRQSVSVPDLSGGINLRDSLTTVQDNQLTDAVNMWFKDGALRTRPGIYRTKFYKDNLVSKMRKHDIFIEDKQLVSVLETDLASDDRFLVNISFFLINESEIVELKSLAYYELEKPKNYLVFKKDEFIYCFISNKIHALDTSDINAAWSNNVEPYAPLIATNYYASGSEGSAIPNVENMFAGATMIDGFNLLGNRFRLIGPTLPKDFSGDFESPMSYLIPYSGKDGAWELMPEVLEVTITDKDTGEKCTHKVDADSETDDSTGMPTWSEHKANEIDGLRIRVTRYGEHIIIDFYKEKNGGGIEIQGLIAADYSENNMEIIAPIANSEENLNKVFGMTECTWFGGASAGINGGTRLFLGGNTNEGEKNLVLWSGLNEPLYFSENCYAYVGDSQQSVTAFGKQSDMLVIFKEHETYFTQYTRNDSITAESLINQSVVDYAASSVYFPLTLIHSHIGCDLPESIQLCRNRLVWTCSDGKVYSLITNNQYSERNIYEVGEMIKRKLVWSGASRDVSSADWQGYYVLMHGGAMYLMDYNSSGFQYAYSYQKNEDANLRIPWYYWKLDTLREEYLNNTLLNIDGTLMVVSAYTGGYTEDGGVAVYLFNEKSDDNGKPIHSSLTTKLFDFGLSGYHKNVDTVQLMLGNNGGAPITVGFVTDCGTEYDEISIDGEETDSYSAGYIGAITLSPCIRSVLRLGVKLSCDGPLTVDSMSLKYRILGGAR